MQVQRREPWWTEQGWWTNLSSNLDRDISKTENWQSKVNQSEVFYEIIKISEKWQESTYGGDFLGKVAGFGL